RGSVHGRGDHVVRVGVACQRAVGRMGHGVILSAGKGPTVPPVGGTVGAGAQKSDRSRLVANRRSISSPQAPEVSPVGSPPSPRRNLTWPGVADLRAKRQGWSSRSPMLAIVPPSPR